MDLAFYGLNENFVVLLNIWLRKSCMYGGVNPITHCCCFGHQNGCFAKVKGWSLNESVFLVTDTETSRCSLRSFRAIKVDFEESARRCPPSNPVALVRYKIEDFGCARRRQFVWVCLIRHLAFTFFAHNKWYHQVRMLIPKKLRCFVISKYSREVQWFDPFEGEEWKI